MAHPALAPASAVHPYPYAGIWHPSSAMVSPKKSSPRPPQIAHDVRGAFSTMETSHAGYLATQAIAQAGTALRTLQGERSRLAEAVRALSEEGDALDAEARAATKSKKSLVEALVRRDAARY